MQTSKAAVLLILSAIAGCSTSPPEGATCTYPSTWTRHDEVKNPPHIVGVVRVKVLIDRDATVKRARVVATDDPNLDETALQIARGLVFNQPTICDGKSYTQSAVLPFKFSPKSPKVQIK
ncbi:energy transducer TonB [Pseudomonas sp. PDM13]|uniref:energy transducer TonB n=1 Tax=Pseudomonas sp. PDM13 TaxID=2769255 RepID=UPI0021E0E512|nr:energy transducer TonB [Pseudomonas sp. PDM13]MCU9949687.1 energy transducer TonB [Pseudomonas sp. PDM13]